MVAFSISGLVSMIRSERGLHGCPDLKLLDFGYRAACRVDEVINQQRKESE
jgi:hypothetical protein